MKLELKYAKNYIGTNCPLMYGCIMDSENDIVEKLTTDTLTHVTDGKRGVVVQLILRPLTDLINIIGEKPEDYKVPMLELAKIMNWTPSETEFLNDNGTLVMKGETYYHPDATEKSSRIFLEIDSEDGNMDYGIEHSYDKPNVDFFPVKNQLELYEWLFDNHFDVYDLIGQGYAIDINKIQNHE